MSTNTSAQAPVPPRKLRTFRHHAVRWSLGLVALLLVTFVVIVAAVFYLIKTVDGQRTLFGAVQAWSNGIVTVVEPAGDIRNNFSAKEVQIALPSSRVLIRNLSYSLADYDLRPPRFHFDRLSAAEVDVSTRPTEPDVPPKSLELPFALVIDALTIGKLSVHPEKTEAAKATVITEISGAIDLGAKAHLVKLANATIDTLRISGDATLAPQAPLALKADVAARQETKSDAAGIPWTASLAADGPLENFRVTVTARAADQSLDATARVQPFAVMPLSALAARFDRFDVSKLVPSAPATTLTGKADIALVKDQPMRIVVEATNATPGPLDRKLLPISALKISASGTSENAVIDAFNAQLSGSKGNAGRIIGSGTWKTGPWQLAFDASDVKLAELDARWPALQVAGRVTAKGEDTTALKPIALKATFKGTALAALIDQKRLPTGLRSGVDVNLTGKIQQTRIELSELDVTAGAAHVRGTLVADRDLLSNANAAATIATQKSRPWRVTTETQWSKLDPFAFIPPRAGAAQSALLNGSIKGNAIVDPAMLTQPSAASADVVVKDSRWGTQPLTGEAKLTLLGPADTQNLPPRIESSGNLVLASNRAQWSGRLGAASDVLTWSLDAQNLSALQALSTAPSKGDAVSKATLSGVIKGQGTLSGKWNALGLDGNVSGQDLVQSATRVQKFAAKLQVALQAEAPFNLDLSAEGISNGAQANTSIGSINLQGKGSLREHRLEATGVLKQGERNLQLSAALVGRTEGNASSALAAWTGAIERLQVNETAAREGALPLVWARVDPFTLRWKSSTPTSGSTFAADAGKALIATVPIDWSALQYTATGPSQTTAKFSGTGNISPFNLVALERQLGSRNLDGDLVLAGRFAVSTDNGTRATLELARQSGDLRIGENAGSGLLGLRELKFTLSAEQGIWRVSQIIDGERVGRAEATANITASAQDLVPPASSPLDGKLTARLDNLAAWGSFLPPGWRLGGGLNGEAKFGGTLGAPKAQGALVLNDLSVKNSLEGVDLVEGRGRIVFVGDQVQLEAVSARGGDGRITVDGKGTLSTKPDVQLTLKAENFRLLGRVDRRVDASGTARLSANNDAIKLDGNFKVDRGFFDISQADAPTLSDDVYVKRKPTAAEMQASSPPPAPPRKTKIDIDLALDLGGDLQLKGRGINTRLAGQLKLSTPGGQLAANGNVRTVRGTYRAYGQDLEIDRGQIAFTGSVSNPRLDILALRARSDPDQTVGVAITGTALSPRIKLYADPDRPDTEKLAMLVTGKSSDNLSRDDTILVQKAAFALLAGEGESISSKFGLDTLGVATNSGTTKDTVVTVGKQISDRLYVGYERGLKATTGTLQLIYRINNSLNIRAQSGEESAIDLFWTLRWDRSPFEQSERQSR